MFQIKICGITSPEDALLAADAGADAIGLNFYDQSPRYIPPRKTSEIEIALRQRNWPGTIAGVFVNSSQEDIFHVSAQAMATAFQLHGDEPPALNASLRRFCDFSSNHPTIQPWWLKLLSRVSGAAVAPTAFFLIRAFRSASADLASIQRYLAECESLGGLPHAVLLDAHSTTSYGGTGQTLDWKAIAQERDKLLGLPLILAGGLTPDNVAQAIATARPDAVDVASGVESSPGRKDAAKIRDFVAAAKAAFAALD